MISCEAVLPVSQQRMASHTSEAFVITCIDPRFQGAIHAFITGRHPDSFDSFMSIPGGAGFLARAVTNLVNPREQQTVDAVAISRSSRAFTTALDALEVAINLHNIQHLYLFCHTSCGGYRIPERYREIQQQKKDLLLVRDCLLEAMHPHKMTAHLYIADGHSTQHPNSIVMRKITPPS